MPDTAVGPVQDHLDRQDPGGVLGVYLYGSATTGGLRHDSDIDLLVVTRRSLTGGERAALVSVLLTHSGWSGHAADFPEVAHRRPIVADDWTGHASTVVALAHSLAEHALLEGTR